MIDSTCFLLSKNWHLEALTESDSSFNRGNYVELIYLMAQRDELLKTHLAMSTIFTGLSGTFKMN